MVPRSDAGWEIVGHVLLGLLIVAVIALGRWLLE